MNLFEKYHAGLPYADFIARYANEGQKERWRKLHAAVALTPAQTNLLASFKREMPILFIDAGTVDFDKSVLNEALKVYCSYCYFDYDFEKVPVNWGISSARKKAFFKLLSEITGEKP